MLARTPHAMVAQPNHVVLALEEILLTRILLARRRTALRFVLPSKHVERSMCLLALPLWWLHREDGMLLGNLGKTCCQLGKSSLIVCHLDSK